VAEIRVKILSDTYYPKTVKANHPEVLHNQLFPHVSGLGQKKVRKYNSSFRPNLSRDTILTTECK